MPGEQDRYREMRRLRKKRRRKHKWLLFLLLLVLLTGFFWWSNYTFQVELFTFTSPRLPEGFDGCVVVQITDLHGATFGEGNRDLLEQVRTLAPDYIFFTGDLQDRYRETPSSYAVELCRAAAQIAPTYYVTGNHEWAFPNVRELKRELEAEGTVVLTNEYVILTRNGDAILLAGIDDPNGFADQKSPEELAQEIESLPGEPFWILLAHRNNYFEDQYSLLGADLTISGHGHGGLIRLPFTDGLMSVERTLFPSYTAGFYTANGAEVFVGRGLGNSGRTFRLFNRPQVVALTLRREANP